MLEVAIPATVPVGEARDVVAVIAPYSDASGLRELLTADSSYSALPDDVRRQPFTLALKADVVSEIPLRLRIRSPDFDPPEQLSEVDYDAESGSPTGRILDYCPEGRAATSDS